MALGSTRKTPARNAFVLFPTSPDEAAIRETSLLTSVLTAMFEASVPLKKVLMPRAARRFVVSESLITLSEKVSPVVIVQLERARETPFGTFKVFPAV